MSISWQWPSTLLYRSASRFAIDHSHLGSLWRKPAEQAVVDLRHREMGFVDRYGEARPYPSQIIHGFHDLEPRCCRRQGEYLDGVDVRDVNGPARWRSRSATR